MAISKKELEKRLIDAGNKLLSPPSSLPELLDSLDLVENLLAGVQQSPSESMKEALLPSTKALIAAELFRHSDEDVKVAVASCISEITRITVPEAPYADELMKEVFQLIVSSFEKLDDKSSRSYPKRISILETVSQVRSCVVMLDLECDELIVEMFRLFFRTIRDILSSHRDDHHPSVFSSMETILILVLEESEAVSVDLLSPILNVLKKSNKEIRPIARQLGENVIVKCASKLKPYLLPAVRTSGASLYDYSKVVADVYGAGDAVDRTDGDASNTNLDDNEDCSAANENTKEADHDSQHENEEPSKTIGDNVKAEKPAKSNKKSKKSNKRKGKKPYSSKRSPEPSEPVASCRGTEVIDTPEHQNDAMDVDNIQRKDAIVDTAENEKTPDVSILSPEAFTPSRSLADETRSRMAAQGKIKEDPVREGKTAHGVDLGKESDTKKSSEEATDPGKHPNDGKAPKTKLYGLELIGATVKVWWPDDKIFYHGVIDSFDAATKKHKVLYSDGDIELLNLKEEKWLLVDQSKGHAGDGECLDESVDDTPKGKKAKTSAELGAKQGKTRSSTKKAGASSSKLKTTPQSGSKQMNDSRTASNPKEESRKKVVTFDEDIIRKSKQGSGKSAAKSKGKSAKSIGKSNSNANGKLKGSPSTKNDETDDESSEPETTPEKSKGKLPSTPKSKKGSKKRKRM